MESRHNSNVFSSWTLPLGKIWILRGRRAPSPFILTNIFFWHSFSIFFFFLYLVKTKAHLFWTCLVAQTNTLNSAGGKRHIGDSKLHGLWPPKWVLLGNMNKANIALTKIPNKRLIENGLIKIGCKAVWSTLMNEFINSDRTCSQPARWMKNIPQNCHKMKDVDIKEWKYVLGHQSLRGTQHDAILVPAAIPPAPPSSWSSSICLSARSWWAGKAGTWRH